MVGEGKIWPVLSSIYAIQSATGVSLRNRTKLDPRPYPLSRVLLSKTGTDTKLRDAMQFRIISLGS
jgi:hypothetical protein